jgi:hypothetical protein
MHINESMEVRINSEDEYREALQRYIRMISDEEEYTLEELAKLMQMLETYEYENC